MKNIFLLSIHLLFAFTLTNASAQVINTIAGADTIMCDNCTAYTAKLNSPGLAVDKRGNVYTTDGSAGTVRVINTAGIIKTIGGNGTYGYSGDGGPATAAAIKRPTVVTVDGRGNVFVWDADSYVIRKIDTAGFISTYAGTGAIGFECDSCAATTSDIYGSISCLATDNKGNLYFGNNFAFKIDSFGTLTRFEGSYWYGYWDSTMDGVNALHYKTGTVFGIAPDDSGNVFIAITQGMGTGVSKIIKVNNARIVSTVAGSDTATALRDGAPATAGWVFAGGLAMDTAGNFYFPEYAGYRIRKITRLTGIVNTIIGNGLTSWYSGFGDGGSALSARVFTNGGVAVDQHGDVYITDVDRIRKIYNSTVSVVNTNTVNEEIKVFPNPATKQLTISSNGDINSIQVLNLIGQVVISQDSMKKKMDIDVSALPVGIYFLKVNNTQVVRFVKN